MLILPNFSFNVLHYQGLVAMTTPQSNSEQTTTKKTPKPTCFATTAANLDSPQSVEGITKIRSKPPKPNKNNFPRKTIHFKSKD